MWQTWLGSGFVWLWYKPAAVTLIRPLAWKPPYAAGAALKRQKDKKKKKKKKKQKASFFSEGGKVSRYPAWEAHVCI